MKLKVKQLSTLLLIASFSCGLIVTSCKTQEEGNQSNLTETNYQTGFRPEVEDLLSKMSVEEKVGQMTQVNINMILKGGYGNQDGQIDEAALREAVVEKNVGSILNALSAYDVELWHEILTEIQDMTQETPNQIPVLYGIDAIHGVTFTQDATLFPQNITMAATRNTDLMYEAGRITAAECRASGLRWNFAPVLDVGRQPLWPRFPETFGEDTYLVQEFGLASIRGLEGDGDLTKDNNVASCMKHFIGYSDPRSGKDRTPAYIPERMLREIFLPPFIAAVEEGSETIMINSGEVNGIPVHGNKYLLVDVLRGELGFKGLAVSDWEDVIRLHERHHVADSPREAVRMGVMAGVDMSMVPHDFSFYDHLVDLVNAGEVPMERIDEAAGRILELKYDLGLFDNPYPEESAVEGFGKPEYKEAALQAAQEAMTLLKNSDNALPLDKDIQTILVTGPASHSVPSLHGSWSYTWQGDDEGKYPEETMSVVEAIVNELGMEQVNEDRRARVTEYGKGNQKLYHTPGTRFSRRDFNIDRTAELAEQSDVAIVVIGEDAYAESPGVIDDLTMDPIQVQLAQRVIETGTPTILVLVEGRPRIINMLVEDAEAILMAYQPGSQGAQAITDVLFGDYNPHGRLPFSYPQFTGDLLTYDHKFTDRVTELSPGRIMHRGYKPQWYFGHGLSYTDFEYSDITIGPDTIMNANETISVAVNVTNTGSRAGKHSVELYTRDMYASVTPSYRRLRKFQQIELEPGETETVTFQLSPDDLKFIGTDGKSWVIEEGEFEVITGIDPFERYQSASFVYQE